ncbi:MAG: DNA gyrase subunit A [Flavobacteriales bacterium]|nr:DNA gyrase subunit A [Flavobacteriales bacterium]|tara:strand:- start:5253 stop:7844 length:2592 start_codon:yes stop_codon:yes gene_type:complete
MSLGEKIIPINIEEEMKSKYIDYSMSVIVSRALPDVRDGLKPVHRRVLFGMHELGVRSNTAYKKSARIVGEVLGKFHPHGDTSVYDAMVRMAQDWSLRYMLVDGQGNFGSIDGDNPAAMRYTEARMRKSSEDMLMDIDKETIDWNLNFDDTLKEPSVLPSRLPNLLLNGTTGIAVGMATNMPPHNLTEVVEGIIAYIKRKGDIEVSDLMEYVKAPDFPTGGIIYGYDGVKSAFETGRGRIVIRGKVRFEETATREQIIVDEIPYMVNKSNMIKQTADLVNSKKLEGIADIRDESDRNGMRIVYDLKRDAIPNIVLNKLYKYTALQSSFSVNNIALVKGRPQLLNLKQLVQLFVAHRHEVLIRKTNFELAQAEKRAHILEGLIIALDNLDAVIQLIRASRTPEDARNGLISNFKLSEIQAKAILDLRLQKLTGLEMDKIKEEHAEIMEKIKRFQEILNNEDLRLNLLVEDLEEVKAKYGDERRSNIEYSSSEVSIEDMIPNEEVLITISHLGYVKRTSLSEYRAQGRGGVGSKGATTRDEDFVEEMVMANNHDYMLFFTERGRCFWLKVYEIPEGGKTSKGRAIQNMINLPKDDKVMAYVNTKDLKDEEYINSHYIVMCTKKGVVKKTSLEQYSRPRTNGINAITIREGDQLLEAKMTTGNSQIMMAVKSGKSIRFEEEKVRSMGRTAAGVRGIRLANDNDEVIGMICVDNMESSVLVVSENGYGKRSAVEDYRITNRGGKGVKTINVTEKTGGLIALKNVTDLDDLMVINKSGITIRIGVDTLRVMGRATQGVKVIRLRDEDKIASVAKVSKWEAQDESLLDEDGNIIIQNEPVEGDVSIEKDADTDSENTDNNLKDQTNEEN